MLFSRLLASVILFAYFATSAHGDIPQLDPDEVEALKQIAKTLGKTDWKFDGVDPCSGKEGWVTPNPEKGYENYVTCNFCSSNNNSSVLHITNIVLKRQNLNGTLPPELVKLRCLQEFDVTRNYLNGTIPPQWASLPLVNISLLGNRITSSIPKEIGSINTLESLVLEFNQLSGTIPDELGNLSRIKRMHLTSNSFSGELPEALSKLTTLKEFRVGQNSFTGKIPDFIGNWRNLTQLIIQASGLEGPIPSSIANLTQMTDLRISDLHGTEMTFPHLKDMTQLEILILRNCNISGILPEYLGYFKSLKTLDLSFNKLSGTIPISLGVLKPENIFLTGNLLHGPLPAQMQDDVYDKKLDLSYNNFSSTDANCNQRNVNWFASSLPDTASGNVPCIEPCIRYWQSFHINCGGKVYIDDKTTYEADIEQAGPSKLWLSNSNWALSSTGYFLDRKDHVYYATRNSSRLFMKNSGLYKTARISPLSLTYFGFCLVNGNYTVKLHFAEIVITDGNTYGSLGRRIFDVYIQGKRVLQDFNIEAAAGGIDKETIQVFAAEVTNNTLEVRFYWAGKGTTSIPDKGTYGPLISAISVIYPDLKSSTKRISAGSIVGIVAAVAITICVLLCILWWKGILCHNPRENGTVQINQANSL